VIEKGFTNKTAILLLILGTEYSLCKKRGLVTCTPDNCYKKKLKNWKHDKLRIVKESRFHLFEEIYPSNRGRTCVTRVLKRKINLKRV